MPENNKVRFNTMIDEDVYERFKNGCQYSGVPMGTLIESFMRQYSDGEFCIRFGSNRKVNIIPDIKPTTAKGEEAIDNKPEDSV